MRRIGEANLNLAGIWCRNSVGLLLDCPSHALLSLLLLNCLPLLLGIRHWLRLNAGLTLSLLLKPDVDQSSEEDSDDTKNDNNDLGTEKWKIRRKARPELKKERRTINLMKLKNADVITPLSLH